MLIAAACAGPAPPPMPRAGLVLLDTASRHVVDALALGHDPVAVAVNTDASMAYMADNSAGDVYGIRLPNLSVAWRTHTGGRPGALLLHGRDLYVSAWDADAVFAVDAAHGGVLHGNQVCHEPGELAAVGASVLVACESGGYESVFDGVVHAGGAGFGLAVLGATVWTAGEEAGNLVPSAGDTLALPAHLHPFWLATGGSNALLVTAEGDSEDRDPGAVLRVVPGAQAQVLEAVVDPDMVLDTGRQLLVADHGGRRVQMLDHSRPAPRWSTVLGDVAAVGLAAAGGSQVLVVTNAAE